MKNLLLLAVKHKKLGITLEMDPEYPACVAVKFPKGVTGSIRKEFDEGYIRRRVMIMPDYHRKWYMQPEDEKPIAEMSRKQLNAAAKRRGVSDPEKFTNKAEVIAAIPEAMKRLISSQ